MQRTILSSQGCDVKEESTKTIWWLTTGKGKGKKTDNEDESMPSECEDADANNDQLNEPYDTKILFDPDTPKDDVDGEESLFFYCKQWESGVICQCNQLWSFRENWAPAQPFT